MFYGDFVVKEIVLHIGSHKTGSTFLQKRFNDNKKTLKNEKIIYPDSWKFLWGHHQIPELLSSEGGARKFYEELDLLNVGPSESVLLSSENFESISSESVGRLKLLNERGNVKIVFYYREFHSIAYSLWQEKVKHGADITFPRFLFDHISKPFSSEVVNASIVLDRFSNVFGRENIFVFHYDKEIFGGGDLYSSFMNELYNIKLPPEPAEKINSSFDPIDIEIIRALNFKGRNSGQAVSNNVRESYVKLLKSGELDSFKERLKFSFEEISLDGSSHPIGSVIKSFHNNYSDRIVSKLDAPTEKHIGYSFVSPNSWFISKNSSLLDKVYEKIDLG